MPGDIHESKTKGFAAEPSEFKVCKAEVNRYSAAFFFDKSVGVNAGQRLYQRGFPVINVAGGADDDGFHFDASISVGISAVSS